MHYVEVQLAGAIGAASARIMVASVVKEEALTLDEVREILDEASQVVRLQPPARAEVAELEAATAELRAANERLKELDRLKDDFVSTVSHELRTPLTSIRAFSEILRDDPNLDRPSAARKFLGIIIKESERLTRLINQVLDLSKIESGKAEWHRARRRHEGADRGHGGGDATRCAQEKSIRARHTRARAGAARSTADLDRMMQVMLNLLSNAVKFCDARQGPRRDRALARPAATCASTCATTAPASARRTRR